MMRECYAIQHALHARRDRADVWGLRHSNFSAVPNFDNYDGIFTLENYEFDWLPAQWGGKPIKLYWIIDAHCQPIEVYDHAIASADIILHSTRRYIDQYRERHPNKRHIYFPNGVDDRYFNRSTWSEWAHRPRTKDLIFIGGNSIQRAEAIQYMVGHGLEYGYGITGKAYLQAVMSAKIQFNKGLGGDINYRNWETIGLGTCLLTEHDPEMELLGFKHDVNCLFYDTPQEAAELARKYLANGEWERIAIAGTWLAKEHTYTKRLSTLLSNLNTSALCLHNLWNTPTPTSVSTSPV